MGGILGTDRLTGLHGEHFTVNSIALAHLADRAGNHELDSQKLPHLQNLYEKYKNDKIKFFLIDITEATRTVKGWENSPKAGPFLANKGITMPILYDSRGIAKERYGAKTLPRLFVVDKYRTIQLAKTGFDENEDFEGELSAVLDRLSAEQ